MSAQDIITRFVNPGVRAIPHMGAFSVVEADHRLHWNENLFDFPADLKEEVLRRMAERPWAYYPDSLKPQLLIEKLADFADVSADMVVADSGSSALIGDIFAMLLGPGDHLVMTSPTFLLYRRLSVQYGVNVHEISCSATDNFSLPVDDLIAAAREHRAAMVVLCAPNNPTGTVYSTEDIRRVVDGSDAVVIIDEAYREFCGQDLRPLLDDYDNVILLRTFSKAYALAGMRIGYAVTTAPLARELQKCVKPFAVNTFGETAALVALDNMEHFKPIVASIVEERERMADALGVMAGVRVFPSGTNFLLLQLETEADALAAHLAKEHSILINTMGAYPELTNCVRISVGRPVQNDLALSAFAGQLGRAV